MTTSIWVCVVCGSRSKDRFGFDRIDIDYNTSHDCSAIAANCMPEKDADGNFVLVESEADLQKRLAGE